MTAEPLLVGLRALGLGDFCCAVPAWKALRRAHPAHRTVLAAPEWQRPLAALCPAIDDLAAVGELEPLPPDLHHADIAVNLHGRGPQSTRLLLAAAPQRLLAFDHPESPHAVDGPKWRADEHEVARWCRLVGSLGIDVDATDLDLERPPVDAPVERASVLHPGASATARRWPVERWTAVAANLARLGHRVVVTGSPDETPLTAAIAERAGLVTGSDLGGRTDVWELAALVAAARLVITGDTGTAHLASAYRTPSVVLFGPTSPATWGPPVHGPHAALWAGHLGDPHADEVDPGLLEITPEAVLEAAATVSTVPTP